MLEFDVQDMIVVTGTRSKQASRNVGLSDVLRKAGQKLAKTFPGGGIGMATAIDEYIDEQNTEVQPLLRNIRDAIRNAAPGATEKISYRMPTFWRGENIIHFAAFKNHIGIYPGGDAVDVFFGRLTGYKTSKGAIQLPIDKPIDYGLITDITRWRMEQIERKRKV
jgi:uncharacterized protein YdhG (YjbR/CyaY superfamily)